MVNVKENNVKYEEERYKEFCKNTGYTFEETYLKFLREYNGGYVDESIFTTSDGKDDAMIDYFYGFCEDAYKGIEKTYEYMKEILPEGVIPIATTVGGDSICISANKGDYGNIYLSSHEEIMENCEDLIYMSSNFAELLQGMKPVEL